MALCNIDYSTHSKVAAVAMFAQARQVAHFLCNHPLTRDHRAAAFVRFCRWQIESRLRREVIVPWIGGIRLAARHGMTGATGNIYAGLHEFADMAFTLHFLRSDDLFLDVGANIGSYTLLASGVCKARTISFEPDPQTMALLRRNIDLNSLHGRVVLEQAAVGAEEGEVAFTIGLDTGGHVTKGNAGRTQRVSMRTLDSVAALTPPTMIKVDVEGYEADVFRGARAVLNSPLLRAVITEGQRPGDVAPLLSAGFVQYEYDPFQRMLSRVVRHGSGNNALFLRDASFVAARLRASPSFLVLGYTI
ncbi:MAG: FkbM family methyltransferase [Xanthobacteraceae bacterium]